MPFHLTPLPFSKNALEPYFSEESFLYHHGKHHQAYVNQLNKLVSETAWITSEMTLEAIIQNAPAGPLYNQAAQVWNHEFFWHCLTTPGTQSPKRATVDLLTTEFGSVEQFQKKLFEQAAQIFGSGWIWLLQSPDGHLTLRALSNGDSPLNTGLKPLLTVDLWEHAYYLDFRNQRPAYLMAYWECLNWAFLDHNILQSPWQSAQKAASPTKLDKMI